MIFVARHIDAPFEAGAGHRQVMHAAFDEADDLIAPRFRRDEVGVVVVEFEQRFLPFRKVKEIARLFHPFALGA